MRPRSVVLLSSGLDSTVNFYEAKRESDVVLALTFDYGQRAAQQEVESAQKIANKLDVPHKVLNLDWFKDFTHSSLVNRSAEVPTTAVKIDDLSRSNETAKAVWVPNRNGIFLNIAAAFAEGLNAQWIIPGFNAEEATTFPDNSQAYLEAATNSLSYSTANKVEVKCFTTHLTKSQIVERGRKLGVDFKQIWPCYFGGEQPCGECESCRRFNRAMVENG
jgi:7-cyano-7-deazaguanine synthase